MKTKIDSQNCYVAYHDILGFKNFVSSHTLEEIKPIFQGIKSLLDTIESDNIWSENKEKARIYNNLSKELYFYIMSDSIILAIDKNQKQSLSFILKYCKIIQQYLIKKKHLLRGGVSVGEFYGDKYFNFGKGLVRAYELESKADMPIIIVDEKIETTGPSLIFCDYQLKTYRSDDKKYIDYCSDLRTDAEELKKFILENKKNSSIKSKYEWLEKELKDTFNRYESEADLNAFNDIEE